MLDFIYENDYMDGGRVESGVRAPPPPPPCPCSVPLTGARLVGGCLTGCFPVLLFFSPCAGIVYCFSQRDCENVAAAIIDAARADKPRFPRGIKAKPYHAGLSENDRKQNQADWSSGKVDIICATIAFGMGARA